MIQHRKPVVVSVLTGVLLLACIPYIRGLNYPLLHDDFPAVINNPLIIKGFHPIKIFKTNAWGGRKRYGMLYRPLWVLGVSFTYNFISDKVWVHRFINILLHALTAMLVTLILLRLKVPLTAAGLAGAFFALQAVHTEAVMFITNRQELQAAFFILLAVYMAIKHANITVQAILLLLALFSKESAVVYPVIYLLILWGLHRARIKKLLLHGTVLFLVTAAYIILRKSAIGYWTSGPVPFMDNPLVNSGILERTLSVFSLFWQAISLMLLPSGLSLDYGFNAWPEVATFTDPRFIAGFIIATLATLFICFGLRHKKAAHVPALFMLIFLVSYGLFSNALFLNTIIFAERNLYLPSAFLIIAIFAFPMRFMVAKAASAFAILLIAGNFAVASGRVTDYKDPVHLYASSLTARPNSPRMEVDLALGLEMLGQQDLAIRHLKRAMHIYPLMPSVYNDLGAIYYKNGQFSKAIPYFLKGVAIGPGSYNLNQHLCLSYRRINMPNLARPYCSRAAWLKKRMM